MSPVAGAGPGHDEPLGPWRGRGQCGPKGIVAVTYASHGGRDDRFCRAVESAVRAGVPWEVLGWGVKWQGLSQKLQASLDYVRRLDPDCVLLFSDAFDVLFTQELDQILAGFRAARAPLLFAGECGCWPQVRSWGPCSHSRRRHPLPRQGGGLASHPERGARWAV